MKSKRESLQQRPNLLSPAIQKFLLSKSESKMMKEKQRNGIKATPMPFEL